MNLRAALPILPLAAALALGSRADAQTVYADPGGRFSIKLPAGWTQLPDSVFRIYCQRSGDDSTFVAAFHRTRSRSQLPYPYAMLQVLPGTPMDPESLAAGLRRYRTGDLPLGAMAQAPPIRYDTATNLVRWGVRQSLDDGTTLHNVLAYRVAGFGLVGLFVYGLERDSLATVSALDQLAAGLSIRPEYVYQGSHELVPAAARPRTGLLDGLGALAFLVMAGVLLGTLRLVGRYRPPPNDYVPESESAESVERNRRLTPP